MAEWWLRPTLSDQCGQKSSETSQSWGIWGNGGGGELLDSPQTLVQDATYM